MAKTKVALLAEEAFVLTDIQEVPMFIDKVVDAAGNEIKNPDGTPAGVENITWTASDPTILNAVNIAADGKTATIRTAGPLTLPEATVQITVTADLIVGDGEQLVTTTRLFKVVASAAVGFTTGLGTPVPRPLV